MIQLFPQEQIEPVVLPGNTGSEPGAVAGVDGVVADVVVSGKNPGPNTLSR